MDDNAVSVSSVLRNLQSMYPADFEVLNGYVRRLESGYAAQASELALVRNGLAQVELQCLAAERRCAELVALLRRVVEAHTGHNTDGCDMRNAEIEHITALTGDDRHAG